MSRRKPTAPVPAVTGASAAAALVLADLAESYRSRGAALTAMGEHGRADECERVRVDLQLLADAIDRWRA